MIAPTQSSLTSFQKLISSYPVPVTRKDKLTRLLEKAIACNQHDNPIDALWAAKRGIRLATTIRRKKSDTLGRLYVEQAIAYRTLGKVDETLDSANIGLRDNSLHNNIKAELYREYATCFRMKNDRKTAYSAACVGLRVMPTDDTIRASLFLEIAMIHYEDQKYYLALLNVKAGLESKKMTNHMKFHLLYLRAVLYREMNNSNKTLEAIGPALDLQSTQSKQISHLYWMKAWALNKKNNPVAALQAVSKGFLFAPQDNLIRDGLNHERAVARARKSWLSQMTAPAA